MRGHTHELFKKLFYARTDRRISRTDEEQRAVSSSLLTLTLTHQPSANQQK